MYKIISFLLIFFSLSAMAQRDNCDGKGRQKIEAQKISFLTQELNLSVEEAQAFWPLYNEYKVKAEKMHSIHKGLRAKGNNDIKTISDDQILKIADTHIKLQLDRAKLEAEYHEKYKKVLKPQQLIKYYRADRKFKNMLLKKLHQRGMHGGGPRH